MSSSELVILSDLLIRLPAVIGSSGRYGGPTPALFLAVILKLYDTSVFTSETIMLVVSPFVLPICGNSNDFYMIIECEYSDLIDMNG